MPFFFLAAMLVHSINLTFIKVHFDFNRDYIADNLCVNRFNPDSDCNGQCYLMKKLKAETEKEAEKKAVFSPVLSFAFFQNETEEIIFNPGKEILVKSYFISNCEKISKDPFLEVDCPPPKYA